MATARIAVLFDAENISCETAVSVLNLLALRGVVQIRRAVGNFSAPNLAAWMNCATTHGIELVLQPSLGKGKNSADIRMTIEAMDIAHGGKVDTLALVTRDRDFTPVAMRMREAGLTVWGFAQSQPNDVFAAACMSFQVIDRVVPPLGNTPEVSASDVLLLHDIVAKACQSGPITPATLASAIALDQPVLTAQLSGGKKFLKRLEALGIVERIGGGTDLRVRAVPLRRAS